MSERILGKQVGYVQLFVYRIPSKNQDAMQQLLKEIADLVRKHGSLYSEFYRLHSEEAFQGFTGIRKIIPSPPGEELWLELDHYRGREQRDQAMAAIGKDQTAGPLFKQLRGLVSEGFSIVMGEFDGIRM
jgi:uncharacterized protein YbaA (DUF1428 family)